MKKRFLIGMAALLSLTIAFFGCEDSGSLLISNAPEAVGDLQAIPYPGSILLKWTPALDADRYEIWREGDGQVVRRHATLNNGEVWFLDQVNFNDSGQNLLKNGQAYTYTVVSINSNAGGNTARASATVTANIPEIGTNLWEAVQGQAFPPTPISSEDIEVRLYRPGPFVLSVPTAPTHIMITINNLNPAFNYNVTARISTATATPFPTPLNIGDGTILFSPANASPRTLSPYSSTNGRTQYEDTMTFIQNIGSNLVANRSYRVVVTFTPRIDSYLVTERLSTGNDLNYVIKNFEWTPE
ncbi:MAG: hypothetical protein FWC01_07030 [Treponema sp.]|nr:hypothetical protein [Treponema sp.]MCL2237585.1 hypothetical protein [Treponema sp.]